MQELIVYLQQLKRFSAPELESIRSNITHHTLQKGDYLSWKELQGDEMIAGEKIAFVRQGILRAVHVDGNGNEVTEYFIDDGHFVPGPASQEEAGASDPIHASRAPQTALRQALTKTELAVVSRSSLEILAASIPGWDQVFAEIRTRIERDRIEWIKPTQAGDATACYKEFLEKFPQIAAGIPLSFVASYLGITQQSFSRVRQKLAKNAYRPTR